MMHSLSIRPHSVRPSLSWLAVWLGLFQYLLCGHAPAQPAHTPPPLQVAEPFHIGVWYFTLWNSADNRGFQVQQAEKFYHRSDVWAGVRDYAEGHGKIPFNRRGTDRPEDFSNREPLLGFYDEMRQDVVDTEIREAASEGIEFFAFYWYLDPAAGREMPISAPVKKFFASAVADRIKFLLAPIVAPASKATMSLETWQRVIVPQIVTYMASPSYYRIEGRPVLVDFKLPFKDPNTYAQGYAYLRRAVAEQLKIEPLIINLLGPQNTHPDLVYRAAKLRPDGFTCFVFPGQGPGEAYADLAGRWIPNLLHLLGLDDDKRDPTLTFLPCGSIGIDARPWYGIGWTGYEGKEGPESRPFTIRPTPDEFRQHLEDLKRFMIAGRVKTFNTVILYAWNEWGEAAASIEPGKKDGYSYADIVREVFALAPRSPRP